MKSNLDPKKKRKRKSDFGDNGWDHDPKNVLPDDDDIDYDEYYNEDDEFSDENDYGIFEDLGDEEDFKKYFTEEPN
ncbi:MAG: hypothetical protein ACXABI_14685 [Candidatus Hodarchaeales archaeon]|jgi:hypothetical protein